MRLHHVSLEILLGHVVVVVEHLPTVTDWMRWTSRAALGLALVEHVVPMMVEQHPAPTGALPTTIQ